MRTLSGKDLPTADTMAENIRRTYAAAGPEEVLAGRAWYAEESSRILSEMVDRSAGRLSRDAAARIVAALSPRIPWSKNVAAALRVAENVGTSEHPGEGITGIFSANVRKASAIAGGDLAALGKGLKTTSFARNLSGDADAVTVDVWAIRVAVGTPETLAPAPAAYRAIADAYRQVARELGETPAALQAICWVVVRGSAA